MKRAHLLLAGLGAVLLVALFWLLLWQPQAEEIATVEERTRQLETQATQLEGEIAQLEAVREAAPEREAELAALRTIVPREAALPAVLRQLQLAADESGVTLTSIVPARPVSETAEGGPSGVASIAVTIDVEGGYYQIVDFLRRTEDPAITPRGLLVNSASVVGDPEEHPLLRASIAGELFAVLPVTGEDAGEVAPPPATEEGATTDEDAAAEDDQDATTDDDAAVDEEADVEVEG